MQKQTVRSVFAREKPTGAQTNAIALFYTFVHRMTNSLLAEHSVHGECVVHAWVCRYFLVARGSARAVFAASRIVPVIVAELPR